MSKEMKFPTSWDAVTLRQFSDYNKVCVKYGESIKENEDVTEEFLDKLDIEMKLDSCVIFSGLSRDEVLELPTALVNEYHESLEFLQEEREGKDIKSFEFEGIKYSLPDGLRINTNYGQYLESVQSEFYFKNTDPSSVMYLSHQLAHTVELDGDWQNKDRDILAKRFEDIPVSIALDFSFFLSKKSKIYSLAYLLYQARQAEKKLPFIKRISNTLVGLKRYMSWQRVIYLKDLTRLRLTVFYIQMFQMFFNIFRTLRVKLTTSTK
tara:strand:- start:493 stop:1287 length:795 start_codon:yes stop_codon:yes gene_type:complete